MKELNITEAARITGVNVNTLRQWIYRRHIPVPRHRMGRNAFFNSDDLFKIAVFSCLVKSGIYPKKANALLGLVKKVYEPEKGRYRIEIKDRAAVFTLYVPEGLVGD